MEFEKFLLHLSEEGFEFWSDKDLLLNIFWELCDIIRKNL